jgi:sulfite exporter TauE/SafE
MLEVSLLSVFLAGLLGGVHCIGMCGGIVGALSMRLPGSAPRWGFHLAYNLGRILTYAVAGAVAGASGLLLKNLLPVQMGLYALANLMLVLLGLYLAGISAAVSRIERLGGRLWRRLQPLTRRFLPVENPGGAFMLGLLWGWLPCGLVYSVLVTAMASGDPLYGAGIMLAFGLGTLPNLLAMGLFASQLQALTRHVGVRRLAGLLVAGFGVWGLVRLAGA